MRKVGGNAALVAAVLVAGSALGGCAGGQAPQAPAGTSEVNIPAPISGGGAAAPTSAQTATPAPTSQAAPTADDSDGGQQQGSAPETGATPQNCTANELSVRLGGSDSGMGHTNTALRFTNRGDRACTLQGSPGVSFVTGSHGAQVGEPAERAPKSSGELITLQPGDSASSPLSIVNAGVFSKEECRPTQARGLRIYAPGDTASMFVAKELTACQTPPQPQMTVDVVR